MIKHQHENCETHEIYTGEKKKKIHRQFQSFLRSHKRKKKSIAKLSALHVNAIKKHVKAAAISFWNFAIKMLERSFSGTILNLVC